MSRQKRNNNNRNNNNNNRRHLNINNIEDDETDYSDTAYLSTPGFSIGSNILDSPDLNDIVSIGGTHSPLLLSMGLKGNTNHNGASFEVDPQDDGKIIFLGETHTAEGYGNYKPTTNLGYIFWLFWVCFALAGVQFIYSIQFALGTPLFNQKFKMTPSTITIIQSTVGPIAGFLIQPIVGVYSDNSTSRFGRRRPYIFAGALASVVGMLAIAFSPDIGKALGDNISGLTPHDYRAGIAFAVIGFLIMNVAINMMQGPCRSLISDLLEPEKQHIGNSMVMGVMGFSSIIANIIGAQLSTYPNSYRNLFLIGTGFTAASVIPTLLVAKERPQSPSSVEKIKSPIQVFAKIGKAFVSMTKPMIIIFFVFFVSWFGFSPYMVSNTNFFGSNVASGDDYNQGLKLGFYATAAFSATQFLFSFFLPPLIKLLGVKLIYSLTQAVAGVALVLYAKFDYPSIPVAIVLTSVVGVNFATFNSIPYTLMLEHTPKNDAGLYMGVLNCAAVISQTISIYTSGLVEEWKHQNSAWAIAYGGLFSLAGVFLVWILPVDHKKQDELDIQSENKPLLRDDQI
ncbi:hypothetical protein DFA_07516 [Cavenderia fasciculata]|uniref:Major facilitator superfamily (MFS) profile domain-containing protein n=1 Tax=Cavenderia fasciculata TaxID=261658 RepID=F4PWM8_CACFS|nr:uncharacterized protein DFA_07516 [Cavenderia fasciculata]EGG20392.1 hypothetical protein DFA_07516 [Cavenderia fasciculata]|eukprot:XP_004367375.1 hypothetical protein DFA_07516 [Cavenderia fasciculata]